MNSSTYDFLQPSPEQISTMKRVRDAAKAFSEVLERELPDGPDKTFTIRNHRTTGMWANVAITRHPDGMPRWSEK